MVSRSAQIHGANVPAPHFRRPCRVGLSDFKFDRCFAESVVDEEEPTYRQLTNFFPRQFWPIFTFVFDRIDRLCGIVVVDILLILSFIIIISSGSSLVNPTQSGGLGRLYPPHRHVPPRVRDSLFLALYLCDIS